MLKRSKIKEAFLRMQKRIQKICNNYMENDGRGKENIDVRANLKMNLGLKKNKVKSYDENLKNNQ